MILSNSVVSRGTSCLSNSQHLHDVRARLIWSASWVLSSVLSNQRLQRFRWRHPATKKTAVSIMPILSPSQIFGGDYHSLALDFQQSATVSQSPRFVFFILTSTGVILFDFQNVSSDSHLFSELLTFRRIPPHGICTTIVRECQDIVITDELFSKQQLM